MTCRRSTGSRRTTSRSAALDDDGLRRPGRARSSPSAGPTWPRSARTTSTRPSWTPVGEKTYGRFLEIRVFDFWVHERDITTPLGWPTDDTGPRAEIALAEVEGSLGYIVGKKIGLPDGASIVFHLTGPLERDLSVVVDGRAKAGRPHRQPRRHS